MCAHGEKECRLGFVLFSCMFIVSNVCELEYIHYIICTYLLCCSFMKRQFCDDDDILKTQMCMY